MLRELAPNAEYEKMEEILHHFKGSCAAIGCKRLASNVNTLLEGVRTRNLTINEKHIDELHNTYQDTLEMLTREYQKTA